MKPPRSTGLQQTPFAYQRWMELIGKTLSNLSFGSTTSNSDPDMNMQCYKATGTTPVTPNTEFSVKHNLKHVPVGFLIASTTPAGHIYKSTTAWTAATNIALGTIFLKSDVASVAFTIIII